MKVGQFVSLRLRTTRGVMYHAGQLIYICCEDSGFFGRVRLTKMTSPSKWTDSLLVRRDEVLGTF